MRFSKTQYVFCARRDPVTADHPNQQHLTSTGLLRALYLYGLTNWSGQWRLATDPFPHLQAMDRNIDIGLKT